jgi:hypothetical protein
VNVDGEAGGKGAVRYIRGGMHQAGSNKLVEIGRVTMRDVHALPAYILAQDHALIRAEGRSFDAACLARSCCGEVDASAWAFRGVRTMLNVSQNSSGWQA